MGFRVVTKSVTLSDLERRNGRYIASFYWIWWICFPTTASICGGRWGFMHESIVFCSACTMSSYRKFTFAISSLDEFLLITASVVGPNYPVFFLIFTCILLYLHNLSTMNPLCHSIAHINRVPMWLPLSATSLATQGYKIAVSPMCSGNADQLT